MHLEKEAEGEKVLVTIRKGQGSCLSSSDWQPQDTKLETMTYWFLWVIYFPNTKIFQRNNPQGFFILEGNAKEGK